MLCCSFCLTSYSSHSWRWRELILNVFCAVLPNSCFSPHSCAPAAPQPEVAQKSISDFPFNSCKMVKVHSVLSEMGHFRRGLYGWRGGGMLEIKLQDMGSEGSPLMIWMYLIKLNNCRTFFSGFVVFLFVFLTLKHNRSVLVACFNQPY